MNKHTKDVSINGREISVITLHKLNVDIMKIVWI